MDTDKVIIELNKACEDYHIRKYKLLGKIEAALNEQIFASEYINIIKECKELIEESNF